MKFVVENLDDRHRALGAQQAVERDAAFENARSIDDIKLPETVREIGVSRM